MYVFFSEFSEIVKPKPGTQSSEDIYSNKTIAKWSIHDTKILIDMYDRYNTKLGTFKIKSMKHMWQVISKELNLATKNNFTPSHCENKWRVLDRGYKKYIKNKKSRGIGKGSFFEFAEEMRKVLGGKKNVTPAILSSDTVDISGKIKEVENNSYSMESEGEKEENIPKESIKKRILTQNTRTDRLNYQEQIIKIELAKLDALKKRNQLIKARNNVLKQNKCCCELKSV